MPKNKTKHADDIQVKAAPYSKYPMGSSPSSFSHHRQRPAENANLFAAENPHDLLTIREFTIIEMQMAADTQDPPHLILYY